MLQEKITISERFRTAQRLLKPTPVVQLQNLPFNLFAKLEFYNPFGSIKDRPAFWMLKAAAKRGIIDEKTTIIESSSGNLACALAGFCRLLGLRFIPVVDPNIQALYNTFLSSNSSRVERVSVRDDTGGFLKTRLSTVRKLCQKITNSYWTAQYENPDCMEAHYHTTGGEIISQINHLDYAFIGVGSAGTIAGVSIRLKERYPHIRIIAVDTIGSVIFGDTPSRRNIPGIGSSIKPPLLRHAEIDDVVLISELDAVNACHDLYRKYGLFVGGSSGSVFAAISRYRFRSKGTRSSVMFLCADRALAYVDTIFNPTWVKNIFGVEMPAIQTLASWR